MMIDEKKLKKELAKLSMKCPYSVLDDRFALYTECFEKAMSLVKEQPKVDEWIPVEEGLPEHNRANPYYEINLVTIEDGDVCLGVYRNDDKEWWTRMSEGESEFSNRHKVVAWKPRPEPYIKEYDHERK